MNLREKAGRYFLLQKLKKTTRQRAVTNIHQAKTAGVLFHSDGKPGEFDKISGLLDYLTQKHIKVDALCYLDKKKIPHYYLHLKNIAVYSKKDLNWFYIPKRLSVKNFIQTKHDLLIDLCTKKKIQIEYVSALSNAKFKIGRYEENSKIHDLMINTGTDDMEFFIEQIKHFLTTINN